MNSLYFSCKNTTSSSTPAPLSSSDITKVSASTPTAPIVWSYVANGIFVTAFVFILLTVLAAFLSPQIKRMRAARRTASEGLELLSEQQYHQLKTSPSAPTSSTMSEKVDLVSEKRKKKRKKGGKQL